MCGTWVINFINIPCCTWVIKFMDIPCLFTKGIVIFIIIISLTAGNKLIKAQLFMEMALYGLEISETRDALQLEYTF